MTGTNELFYLEKLNNEQLLAVKTEKNCAVSAGAGSGKTRVLSKRFIYLLLERKIPIEKIIALTFTKKAAAEMNERIYSELTDVAAKLEGEKKVLAKVALDNFVNAHISTLDSFCSTIARNGCKQFGISPDFIIDPAGSDEIAARVSLDFFLQNRNNSALTGLIGTSSIDNFISDLFISFLDLVTVSKPVDMDESKRLFDKSLNELFKSTIHEAEETIKMIVAAPDFDKPDQKIIEAQKILSKIKRTPKSLNDIYLNEFLSILKKLSIISLSGGQPKDPLKVETRNAIRILKPITAAITMQKNFFDLRELNFTVFDLLNTLQQQVILQKRIAGSLNYNDVAQLAIDCLTNDFDLRNYYKNEYDAIMIDEFQDNNKMQRDLLFLISEKKDLCANRVPTTNELEPNKLFFVGDEKQSIYLFRKADVSVFKNLTQEFSDTEKINLDTNYRTEKKLIEFFNDTFKKIFYSDENKPADLDEEHLSHEAFFTDIKWNRETKNIFPSADIFLTKTFKDDMQEDIQYLDVYETEAFILANKIAEMVQSNVHVRDKETNQARACRYSDFAILFKSKTHQQTVERFLRQFGIPYKAEQQQGIFYDAPINDMLALIKLALHPNDKTVFAEVLRSPFVALDDAAITKLFLHMTDEDAFDERFENIFSGDALIQFRNSRSLFLRVKKYTSENTAAEIISKLWYDEGYRYLLLQNENYRRYIELYDYIFEIARQCDAAHASIENFVQQVSKYISAEDKLDDMDIPVLTNVQTADTVKLLTIHKSKGLEFPIVCIPYCAAHGQNNILRSKLFYSEKYGLSINMETEERKNNNIFYDRLKDFEDFKKTAELKRVLYVALTRAECHLIMTGIQDKEYKDTFFYLLNPVFDDYLNELEENKTCSDILHIHKIEPVTLESYSQKTCSVIKRATPKIDSLFLKADQKTFSPAEKKYFTASHLHDEIKLLNTDDDENKIEKKELYFSKTESEQVPPSDLGTVTHAVLEMMLSQNMSPDAALKICLAKKTVPISKEQGITIIKWCKNFLDSELGMRAASSANKKTEYGLITKYEEKNVVGKIDLLFESDGALYIIDYKTDTVQNPEIHREQLAVYKEACKNLFKKNADKIKAFLFYLRTGNAVEV